MSSGAEETPATPPPPSAAVRKKKVRKEALKADKLRRKQEDAADPPAAAADTDAAAAALSEVDILAGNYNDVPMEDVQSKHHLSGRRRWTEVGDLDPSVQTVLLPMILPINIVPILGDKFVPVKFLRDTRLNLDLLKRTPAYEAIFRVQYEVEHEAGVDVDPLGHLNKETKRKLGRLVLEKYNTDFYILHRYPLAVRPFYTMPCYDDSRYSNSFDVFIRGEEIISGAQRVHSADLLTSRAEACGIDVKTISKYIDSFRCVCVLTFQGCHVGVSDLPRVVSSCPCNIGSTAVVVAVKHTVVPGVAAAHVAGNLRCT